jgi:hypothetical protein
MGMQRHRFNNPLIWFVTSDKYGPMEASPFFNHYSLPLSFHYKQQSASSTCIKYGNISCLTCTHTRWEQLYLHGINSSEIPGKLNWHLATYKKILNGPSFWQNEYVTWYISKHDQPRKYNPPQNEMYTPFKFHVLHHNTIYQPAFTYYNMHTTGTNTVNHIQGTHILDLDMEMVSIGPDHHCTSTPPHTCNSRYSQPWTPARYMPSTAQVHTQLQCTNNQFSCWKIKHICSKKKTDQ